MGEGRTGACRWIERAGWVVLGLSIPFATAATIAARPIGSDAWFYRFEARSVMDGISPYPAFAYPPPALLLFAPAAMLPEAIGVWSIEIPFILVAVLVAVRTSWSLPRLLRPWSTASFALFFPLLLDLNLGNVNMLVTALSLAAYARRRQQPIGGALLACALMLKPIAGLVVVFYAAAREWGQLAWGLAAGIAITLLTLPWVGRYWIEYPGLLVHRATADMATIRPPMVSGTIPYVALALLACAIALAAGAAARRSPVSGGEMHAVALAGAPLLIYGILYMYLVLALPLIVTLVRALARRPWLLILPALAWGAMQRPLGYEAWRFGGYLAMLALGVALVLIRLRQYRLAS